jgi:hypothetical protein
MHTVGSIDAENYISRGLHLTQLERVCLALGIGGYEAFRDCVKEVLWVGQFEIFVRQAWEDVELSIRMNAPLTRQDERNVSYA